MLLTGPQIESTAFFSLIGLKFVIWCHNGGLRLCWSVIGTWRAVGGTFFTLFKSSLAVARWGIFGSVFWGKGQFGKCV